MKRAREGGRQLHLFGLVSDGGVHSHQEHLYALLRTAREYGLERVFVHAFMDGRDTPPDSGAGYIAQLEQKMREYGVGKVATINGRYYAMDRDKRWERERKAFDAMVNGKAEGGAYPNAVARIKENYNNGITDEFLIPFVVVDARGQAGRADSRRGCLHQLQLPRRPRPRDYARADARERPEQAGRPRPGRLGVARRHDSTQRNSQGPLLPLHDAVRQALRAAADHAAGVAGQHSGQRAGPASSAQSARGRDGEVRARDLLFQRRHRDALPRRRSRADSLAEGRNLRPGSGDEGRGHRRRDREGDQRRRLSI